MVKIKYSGAYGEEQVGYTTKGEIEKARHGETTYIWFTDSPNNIKDGRITFGWTLDWFEITKVYDAR